MKLFILVLILLTLIGVGAGWLYITTVSLHQQIQDELNLLEKTVNAENWEYAREHTASIKKLWHKADLIWTPVIDHRTTDRVDESITRVIALTDGESKDDAIVEIVLSRRLLERLKEKETPLFRSVF